MDKACIGIHPTLPALQVEPGGEGDVFGGEKVVFVEPSHGLENLRTNEKGGSDDVVGLKQPFLIDIVGDPDGGIAEEVKDKRNPRVGRSPAHLDRAVGIVEAGGEDGNTLRSKFQVQSSKFKVLYTGEIIDQLIDDGHGEVSIVIEDEGVFSRHLSQGEIVILGEASDFVALNPMHAGIFLFRIEKVLRGEHIGHYPNLVWNMGELSDAVEAGI